METKNFLKHHSGYFGEEVDSIKQIAGITFTGEELLEYVNSVIEQNQLDVINDLEVTTSNLEADNDLQADAIDVLNLRPKIKGLIKELGFQKIIVKKKEKHELEQEAEIKSLKERVEEFCDLNDAKDFWKTYNKLKDENQRLENLINIKSDITPYVNRIEKELIKYKVFVEKIEEFIDNVQQGQLIMSNNRLHQRIDDLNKELTQLTNNQQNKGE